MRRRFSGILGAAVTYTAIVIDEASGAILFEKNAHQARVIGGFPGTSSYFDPRLCHSAS
jgi:hypothetical protein